MTDDLDLSDAIAYRDWHRILFRTWLPHLTHAEYILVEMIFDRTIGWGKEWEFVSLKQFTDGVYSNDKSKCYCPGTGLSRQGVVNSLAHLLQLGCISIQKTGQLSNRYRINFDWNLKVLREPKAKKERRSPLAVSKKALPRAVNSVDPLVKSVDHPSQLSRPKEDSNIRGINKEEERSSAKAGSGSEIIRGIAERHKEKKVQLLAKLLTERGLKQNDLHKLWDIAMKETYPETPYFAWKDKDGVILKLYAKRYENSVSDVSFGKYLDWVIRYWRVVIQQSFHWMTDPPNFPAIGFLVRFSAKFEDTFARRAELEKLLALPTRERMIMTLTRKGMPVELAEDEVDQQLAVSRQLQEIKAIQSKLDSDRYKIAREWTRPLQPAFMKR